MSAGFSTVSHSGALEKQVEAIGEVLRFNKWTVSCAESCTGGGLAYAFTAVPGSSDWFLQSWVTYANSAKQNMLGVSADTLASTGAVSSETVLEMARGVAQHSAANIAISVSGVAGPGGGSLQKPVGTVWFGFAFNGEIETVLQHFKGDRKAVREQAVAFAIDILYQRLVAEK